MNFQSSDMIHFIILSYTSKKKKNDKKRGQYWIDIPIGKNHRTNTIFLFNDFVHQN